MRLAALKKAVCETVFRQEVTSARVKRPTLARSVKTVQTGDTLIVWKPGRPRRGLRDLIHMLDGFRLEGIRFRSLTEASATETRTGHALSRMIGVLAKPERSLITERTRAGVKAARMRGMEFGLKVTLTPDRLVHARPMSGRGFNRLRCVREFYISIRGLHQLCDFSSYFHDISS